MTDELIEQAVKIAKKLIRPLEELELRAYPDPASPLSKALSAQNKLTLYKAGKFVLTEDWLRLSPEPVSIGYGQTGGIRLGDVWSEEQAEKALDDQVRGRVVDVLKSAPNLLNHSAEKIAACVSLQYNIGSTAFKNSTVAKMIAKDDMIGAANSFGMWIKAGGKEMQGLVNRRAIEKALFLSVKG